MNKLRVKSIIDRLRTNLCELESEILADKDSYLGGASNVPYEEVEKFYQSNDDDDGYPD